MHPPKWRVGDGTPQSVATEDGVSLSPIIVALHVYMLPSIGPADKWSGGFLSKSLGKKKHNFQTCSVQFPDILVELAE